MRILAYASLGILLLNGCSTESDPEKIDTKIPVIVLEGSNPGLVTDNICNTTETHVFPLVSEQTLELDLSFSDDVELSQYKIDIHHNFDCHSHRIGYQAGEPWFVSRIEKLESNHKRIQEKLTVPSDVLAGNYHLLIYCLDKVGNEAEPLVFSMKIKNNNDLEPPKLTLTSPSENGISVKKGASITFSGEVSDNKDLDGGRIELFYYDPANTLFTVSQYFFPEGTGDHNTFSIPYTVEATSALGTHKYHIKVYDNFNNTTEKIITVTIE